MIETWGLYSNLQISNHLFKVGAHRTENPGNGRVLSTLAKGRLWQDWASRHQALTVELAQYSKPKSTWRSMLLEVVPRLLRSYPLLTENSIAKFG